jgi:hypothetical protein
MTDDFTRETQPSGALVPPRRNPPTAVATAAPLPPPMHRRTPWMHRSPLQRFLGKVFDGLDTIGDRIARAAGLRV